MKRAGLAERVYLDWNATAPLRPEARAAMIAAMDVVGNPSSVHAEGRAAKALVERARGAGGGGARGRRGGRGLHLRRDRGGGAGAGRARGLPAPGSSMTRCAAWCDRGCCRSMPTGGWRWPIPRERRCRLANSETGVVQDLPDGLAVSRPDPGLRQAARRLQLARRARWRWSRRTSWAGPRASARWCCGAGSTSRRRSRGGGQEMGRRSGTENVHRHRRLRRRGRGGGARSGRRASGSGSTKLRNILETAIAAAEAKRLFLSGKARRGCRTPPAWSRRAGRARRR